MFIFGVILLIIAVISIVIMKLYDVDLVLWAVWSIIFGLIFLAYSPEKP